MSGSLLRALRGFRGFLARLTANWYNTCSIFGADSSIRYDAHSYRLMSLDRLSLNTIHGRVVGQLIRGENQRARLYDTIWKVGGPN